MDVDAGTGPVPSQRSASPCPRCGVPQQPGARFCGRCGAPSLPPAPPMPPFAPPVPAPGPPSGNRTLLIVLAVLGAVLVTAVTGTAGVVVTRRGGAAPSAAPAVTVTATERSDFSALYRSVSGGVVRIETTACEGGEVGSGFLVAPTLVATVAHVVDGSVSIVVRGGSTTTTGVVVGLDPEHELALVRTARPLSGHVFEFSASEPGVGTDVAAIGYPLAGEESLTKGTVSGLDRPIDTEAGHLEGLVQTDAAINPGNSGGPLIGLDGRVVGLVEAKNNQAESVGYAIPATTAAPVVARWAAAPQVVTTADECSAPAGPDGAQPVVVDDSGHPDGEGVSEAFATYAEGINTGDYAEAFGVLSPRAQGRTTLDDFAAGELSSYLVALTVHSVRSRSSDDLAEVTFMSVQEPQFGVDGQACSIWDMTYTMVFDGQDWRIDRAAPHPGSPRPC